MTPRYEAVTNSSLWNWQTRADFKASGAAPSRSQFPERMRTILQNRAEQRAAKAGETHPEGKSSANFSKPTPLPARETRDTSRTNPTAANQPNAIETAIETSASENLNAETDVLTSLPSAAIPVTETSPAASESGTAVATGLSGTILPETAVDSQKSPGNPQKTAPEETVTAAPLLLTRHLSRKQFSHSQSVSANRSENSVTPQTETVQDQADKSGNLAPFLKALSNGSAATLAAGQAETAAAKPVSAKPVSEKPEPAALFSTPDAAGKNSTEAADSTVVDEIPVAISSTNIVPKVSSEVLPLSTIVDQPLKPAASSPEKTTSQVEKQTEPQPADQTETSQQSAAIYQNNTANATSYQQTGSAETQTLSPAEKLTDFSVEMSERRQAVSTDSKAFPAEEQQTHSIAINPTKFLQEEQTRDYQHSPAEGLALSSLSPKAVQDAVKSTAAPVLLNLESPEFPQKLVGYLQQAAETGQSLKIRLNPPELGTLQIEVARQAGQTIAVLEVESVAAKTIILEQIALLRDSLQQQGLKLDQLTVEVNEQFAQSTGQESLQQDQSGNSEHHRDHNPAETPENEQSSTPKPQPQGISPREIHHRQQIDVQI